jgi:hypothetical protein
MKLTRAVIVGCLLPALFLGGGCTETTHYPPKVIGARKDAQGKVVQEIVYQDNFQAQGRFPGPEGDKPIWNRRWFYCYLREPGKPERELGFLRRIPGVVGDHCYAVDGTQLWAMITVERRDDLNDFRQEVDIRKLLVFDESRVLHQIAIDYKDGWAATIAFHDGNRKVVYRSSKGWRSLDVVTGAVMPFQEGKKPPNAPGQHT